MTLEYQHVGNGVYSVIAPDGVNVEAFIAKAIALALELSADVFVAFNDDVKATILVKRDSDPKIIFQALKQALENRSEHEDCHIGPYPLKDF